MKRCFDFFFALLAIIFFSPLCLIVSMGIYISDPGPIFYRARRVGLGGEAFSMLKFRTMFERKADNDSKITSRNDERIFKFGKVLRKFKIDELPQLINILKGDMTIIGPRPEHITIVDEHYNSLMRETLKVKPGLASPGSIFNYTHLGDLISERKTENFYVEEILPIKLALDVVYSRNRSFLYDFSIVFRTIKVIMQKGLGYKKINLPPEYEKAKKLLSKEDISIKIDK